MTGHRNRLVLILLTCFCITGLCTSATAATGWSSKLDGDVNFYQDTDFGILLAATEKSLYAIDGESGEILWRRKAAKLDAPDIAPVPGTDMVLISLEDDSKARLEAVDIASGESIWRSDKVRGAVMQMAVDPGSNLLAAVLVRNAKGRPHDGLKRKPRIHVFDLKSGDEVWDRELESEVEMMPSEWSEENDKEVAFTLDNYRPPVFMDDRLYLFYEGLTSLEARTGKDRRREKFRVNEEGLALTESDPVADETAIYISGHGRVRAISRLSGDTIWEANDLGTVPEMVLTANVLFARTGGRFTRIKDGETVERGPYGVSAIDTRSGKVLWRFKGADKGITNLAFPDPGTILIADRDDLIAIDASIGKRSWKLSHKVDDAAFVLLNERGQSVVGGRNEIAGFDLGLRTERWRERHDPPGRGVLRTVAAIAARAAALYFRYGGAASTALRGIRAYNVISSLRWSGLASSAGLPNLTTLASNYARDYSRDRISTFGILSRVQKPNNVSISQGRQTRVTGDVQERLLDRIDPANQLERLSRFLWRRRQLASFQGRHMYFFTDTPVGRGIVGVNVDTGRTDRIVKLGNPDDQFITDEVADLLYSSSGNRLGAFQFQRIDGQ
jgi:outer membrane protein assembly factor BamB